MKQVIFDTDIGIDDAMALLFLHFAADVDLRAIITGFGNADIDTTTRNALFMKHKFGIEAPVYRGAAGPIGTSMFDDYPDFVHGKNGLGDIEIPDVAATEETSDGATAIVDLVTNNPQQISIVAVGRMTNLANALALCPELPRLVREVIVMGGAFGFNGHRGNVSPVAEANIAGDPTAADRVFSSGLPLTVVGLDVTEEVILTDAQLTTLRDNGGDAGQFVYQISRNYLRFHEQQNGRRECPVHDSSAVAYLLRPDLYATRTAVVRVVTEGVALGQTIWADPDTPSLHAAWSKIPGCEICTGVDSQSMLRFFLDTMALAAE